jgi:nitrogen fixation/metabolism regulation signal transduction histidine kinase
MQSNVIITVVLQILLAGSMIVLVIRRFVGVPIRDLITGTKSVAKMDLDEPISIRDTHRSPRLCCEPWLCA